VSGPLAEYRSPTNASLNGASLDSADLTNANFTGVKLCKAALIGVTGWDNMIGKDAV
jgi:uncharacterized protein YjbI with pentapeptide repeats